MDWTSKDTGTLVNGLGSLASAWGQYETDKKKNKLLEEQLQYEKDRDLVADAKMTTAQSNLETAFDASALNTKKKKKKTSDYGVLESDADSSIAV